VTPVSSIVFVILIDGVDTGDSALPDDAGADGVELPVGEYDATLTSVPPIALALTVPEIVSIPLSPVARSKPVHLSVVVLYVPTVVSNVIPESPVGTVVECLDDVGYPLSWVNLSYWGYGLCYIN